MKRYTASGKEMQQKRNRMVHKMGRDKREIGMTYTGMVLPFVAGYRVNQGWDVDRTRLLLDVLPQRVRMDLVDIVAPEMDPKAKSGFLPMYSDAENQMDFRKSLLEEMDDTCDFARALLGFRHRRSRGKLTSQGARRKLDNLLAQGLKGHYPPHPVESRLAQLAKTMKLTAGESAVLLTAWLCRNLPTFGNILGEHRGNLRCLFIGRAFGLPGNAIHEALASSSTIRQCEFIDSSPYNGEINLEEDINSYFESGKVDSLLGSTCQAPKEKTLALSDFTPPVFGLAPCIESVVTLFKSPKPCHVLFYGEPGVGKTQLARVLAREAGLTPRFLTMESDLKRSRLGHIQSACRLLSPATDLLVIDEADGILNTGGDFMSMLFGGGNSNRDREKGPLNMFFDHCRMKTLWITNDHKGLSSSVCRRFHYSWEFHGLQGPQRRLIWEKLIAGHPRAKQIGPHLADLADRYPIDIGGVKNALETLRRFPLGRDPKVTLKRLEHLLERHHHIFRGKAAKPPAKKSGYDPGILNTDVPLSTLTAAARDFYGRNTGAAIAGGENLNMLLWGKPGTGKTAWAKELAASLGVELITKKASDLRGMYVGQTEKQIAMAFRQAAQTRSVLLIDEADSFLSDRTGHQVSHETSFVNEFLTQMENHGGILICSTNLLSTMDPAAARRFAFKVEFRPPKTEALTTLLGLYFPGVKWGDAGGRKLSALTGLTPGDVAAVALQAKHLPAGTLTGDWILERLENELRYRKEGDRPSIGFGRA